MDLYSRKSAILRKKLKKYNFRFDFEKIKKIMDDYRFPTIKKDLRTKLSMIRKTIDVYEAIRNAAELIFNEKIYNEIKEKYEIADPGNPPNPFLTIYIQKSYIDTLGLRQAVFQQINPTDFLNSEKEKFGKNLSIDVTIKSSGYEISDFEYLYSFMIRKMENEELFNEEKIRKSSLLEETEVILKEIKDLLTLP